MGRTYCRKQGTSKSIVGRWYKPCAVVVLSVLALLSLGASADANVFQPQSSSIIVDFHPPYSFDNGNGPAPDYPVIFADCGTSCAGSVSSMVLMRGSQVIAQSDDMDPTLLDPGTMEAGDTLDVYVTDDNSNTYLAAAVTYPGTPPTLTSADCAFNTVSGSAPSSSYVAGYVGDGSTAQQGPSGATVSNGLFTLAANSQTPSWDDLFRTNGDNEQPLVQDVVGISYVAGVDGPVQVDQWMHFPDSFGTIFIPQDLACGPVTTPPGLPPINTAPPTISTQPQSGVAVAVAVGEWTNEVDDYSWQWQLCDPSGADCADIDGATDSQYTPTDADVGSTLRVIETASNQYGSSDPVTSDASGVVRPPATATPPPAPGAGPGTTPTSNPPAGSSIIPVGASCDVYKVAPHHQLSIGAPGVLANDTANGHGHLTPHVDHISFGVSSHPYQLSPAGALSFQATEPGAASLIYHDTASDGAVSAPTTVTIFIQAGALTVAQRAVCGAAAPVAVAHHWSVEAGQSLEENLLTGAYGGRGELTTRILNISFAHGEWTGADKDGQFLYVAGPGTEKSLLKKIRFEAVDSHGIASAPVTSTVAVDPRKSVAVSVAQTHHLTPQLSGDSDVFGRLGAPHATTAAASSVQWYSGGMGHIMSCWSGSGEPKPVNQTGALGDQCWTVVSVPESKVSNDLDSWSGKATFGGLLNDCLGDITSYLDPSFLVKKAAFAQQCASGIAGSTFDHVWDKSVYHNAAMLGDCLAWKIVRHRTLTHPVSGAWSSPQLDPVDSLIPPYEPGNPHTGWVYEHHLFSSTVRVPMSCDSDGEVSSEYPAPITYAPGF
jgi:hypothetical protein